MARANVIAVTIVMIAAIGLPMSAADDTTIRDAKVLDSPLSSETETTQFNQADDSRRATERVIVELYAQAGLPSAAENTPRLLEPDQAIDLTSSLTADTPDLDVSLNMTGDWRFSLADGADARPDHDDFGHMSDPASDSRQLQFTSLGLTTLAVHAR